MTLQELLLDELKDLYDAEQQLARALPRLAGAAMSDGVRSALESHLEETRNHARRIEDVFVLLGVRPAGQPCTAMAGILAEIDRTIGRADASGTLRDAGVIGGLQKAEHLEMAGYGTAAARARALGLTEIATSLEQTLEEEKAANQALNDLAEEEVNVSARHEAT